MNLAELLDLLGLSQDEITTAMDAEKGKDFDFTEKVELLKTGIKNELLGDAKKITDEQAESIRHTQSVKLMKTVLRGLGINKTANEIDKLKHEEFEAIIKDHNKPTGEVTDEVKALKDKNAELARQVTQLQDEKDTMIADHESKIKAKDSEAEGKINKFYVDSEISKSFSRFEKTKIDGVGNDIIETVFNSQLQKHGINLIYKDGKVIPVDSNGNMGIKNPFTKNGSIASSLEQIQDAFMQANNFLKKNNNGNQEWSQSQGSFGDTGQINPSNLSDHTKSLAAQMGIPINN